MLRFHPEKLSFLLRASSDTFPTPMNLRHWKIQTSSSCHLCSCQRPTTAHILNGCPIALQQRRYTYRHDQVLLSLLVDIGKYCDDANIFADLDNYRAGNTPLATIPPSTTSYRPDIMIYNAEGRDIRLLEFICPFNSTEHLQAAWDRKSSKMEYRLLISELHRIGFPCQYVTIEIGCLGHYLPETSRKPSSNPLLFVVLY